MSAESVLVIDDSPTILKVVQLVLTKAGFEVKTAPDGEAGLAAARESRPALILLDFVMPRMNGYQVCRALSQDDDLKDVPVVLMSAKGDQVGERFVKVMGIVDYITKPFSPEAITAVVQHSIEKYTQPAQELTRPLLKVASLEKDDDADVAASQEQQEQRKSAIESVRNTMVELVASKVAGLFSLADAAQSSRTADTDESNDHVPTDADAIADATRAALDDDTLANILQRAEPLLSTGDASPSLRGDLRVVPIAEVLQLLAAQNQSGTLEIERGPSRVEVYFRDGRVDLCVATNLSEEYLLGRFVVELGLMTVQDLEGFLESRTGSNTTLIGSQLQKLGYLSDDELTSTLTKQTRELLYEVLRWRFGSFRFCRSRDLPAKAATARLGLDVEGILMEGFRRVDEWHLIEQEINDFDMVFLRNEDAVAQMGRGRLTREELAILELVNGKNTVKEIIRTSRMGSFDVSKMLYRLLSIKLIRRRVMPVAV